MNTFKKTLALLTPHERKRGQLVMLLLMGMALLETLGVASVMPFLAVLGNPEMLNTNLVLSRLYTHAQVLGIRSPENFLIFLGLSAFVLIIFSAAYRMFAQYVMNRFIEMRRHSIGERLLETYLRQPYAFFLNRHSGDLSKIILSEVDQLIGNLFRPVCNLVAYSLVLVAITALLLLVDPWLALLAAGLLGGLYAVVFLSLKRNLLRLGESMDISNKDRFLAVSETIGGIKDIKLRGREQIYLSRFKTPSEQFSASQAAFQTIHQVPNYLIEGILFGTMLLLTIFLMVKTGGLGGRALERILPILGVYVFAAYRMKPAVHYIYQGFASLRCGRTTVDNLYADLYHNNVAAQLPTIMPVQLRVKHCIALHRLSYTYPGATKSALTNLHLEIPVGSSVGLVGTTGAGKTTLVDVVLGLLRPTQGAIMVDGEPVTDELVRAWQQSIGYVPQEIFLAHTTIAENIALGIPKGEIDQTQVEICAQIAQVHNFIVNELPAQYLTQVGERGVRLSGGQRQRIGIARALYNNPEVLVFDEATSALDTVTEKAVLDAIDVLARQKTIIIIAHRLSSVKNCDQIVMLDHGTIKAKGMFNELKESNEQFKIMSDYG